MNSLIIAFAGTLAALITFFVNNNLKLGGIAASAGVAVISGLWFYLFPDVLNHFLTKNLPLVIMGASFVGMASKEVIGRTWMIPLAGLLFSLIYLITGSSFQGFGGSLGTTAAISLFSIYILTRIKRPKESNSL